MLKLCIDLEIVANNANIKTHNENWNGKWCPSKILNEGRLQQVKNAIIEEYNRLIGKKEAPAPSKDNKKADGHLSFSQVVDKTIAGGYGVYPQREKNINVKTNFTYKAVQDEVNKRFGATKTKPSTKPAPKRKSN